MQLKMQIKQPIHYYNNIITKLNLNKMSSIEYRTHFYNN
ncbi:IS3 family transposase [Empedobacter falsenii]